MYFFGQKDVVGEKCLRHKTEVLTPRRVSPARSEMPRNLEICRGWSFGSDARDHMINLTVRR